MMQATRLDLLDQAYVDDLNARWAVKPSSMTVVEFAGTGDPAFGGSADDRPLGVDGQIKDRRSSVATAEFSTIEAAHAAAIAITNRRPGSLLGVLPVWNRTEPAKPLASADVPTDAQDRTAAHLIACGVPMARKTDYRDGVPVRESWLVASVTRRGSVFRVNGRRVARSLATEAITLDIAKIAG
ncbi:hypothetical protein KDW40_02260 [Burkholderia cenocepacia]|uniref:hypothetical protein n=1 Tax=Burkholderia cenocepacia TaxID=95486 RepID=UPI001B9CCB13|nr:hypothetical protein [Burkholderia cenocepacia]MBR8043389.1 hypothetical protein [Burkholderia cenocepacia]MBR8324554.1 hypothetical protein [Burkholderia cenocepacia]